MGGLRRLSRIISWVFILYSVWQGFKRRRWVGAGWLLWSLITRRKLRDSQRAATLTFVNGGNPAVYRRRGWRKVYSGATHSRPS